MALPSSTNSWTHVGARELDRRIAMMNPTLAIVLLLAASMPAHAQSLQCGTAIIGVGATTAEVRGKCGEPTQVEKSSIVRSSSSRSSGPPGPPVGPPGLSGPFSPARPPSGQSDGQEKSESETPVEVWLYNLGPNKLLERLRFEDGNLVKIDTLGYGY